ncbi:MAG: hypothetical protein ACLU8F_01615 [Clostridia bacterium]
MIDGIYDCKMNTQMGDITGKITLKTNGNELSGIVETMGTKNQFTGGKLQGNTCNFKGSFNTMLGRIDYNINGKVVGNQLEIVADTNKGKFCIKGTKVE